MQHRKIVYVLTTEYANEDSWGQGYVEGVYGNKHIAEEAKRDYEEQSKGRVRATIKEFHVRN